MSVEHCIQGSRREQNRLLLTQHDSLTLLKTILQSTLKGSRCHNGQRKNWLMDIKDWSRRPIRELLAITQNKGEWQALSATRSIHVFPPITGAGQGMTD